MKIILAAMLSFFPGLLPFVQTDAPAWRGITPLHTTREVVERLLGPPDDPSRKASAVYLLENEVVLIFFTSGAPCSAKNKWQVPEGTVLEFTVTPKKSSTLSDLHIDESQYKKAVDPDNVAFVRYTNQEIGRSINVHHGKVSFMTFFPATHEEHLRCSGADVSSSIRDALQDLHAIDTYGNMPSEDEHARLDNFAVSLHNTPKAIGYIVAYTGQGMNPDETRIKAERAKRYLSNKRGISAERIVVVTDGKREQFTVELYIVLPRIHPLTPSTTFKPNRKQARSRKKYHHYTLSGYEQ